MNKNEKTEKKEKIAVELTEYTSDKKVLILIDPLDLEVLQEYEQDFKKRVVLSCGFGSGYIDTFIDYLDLRLFVYFKRDSVASDIKKEAIVF